MTGDVYMIVNRHGMWKSTDSGKTFERCDGGKVSGRCETSFSLNADPAGSRFACFMLDGKCAWTGDGGDTWHPMADVGRNWDYAAVDWSTPDVMNIFAGLHESGGQVLSSIDAGKTWGKLFKQPEFDRTGGLGIFDAKTLVYTQKGCAHPCRSTDGAANWKKVSDLEPIGRVALIHMGSAYWLRQRRAAREQGSRRNLDRARQTGRGLDRPHDRSAQRQALRGGRREGRLPLRRRRRNVDQGDGRAPQGLHDAPRRLVQQRRLGPGA